MKVEVGKVYKCGGTYVYIDYESQSLTNRGLWGFIGIKCNSSGRIDGAYPFIGRFSSEGIYSDTNPDGLKAFLQELPERETITVITAGSSLSVYYKDEFEAATKHLKEVK